MTKFEAKRAEFDPVSVSPAAASMPNNMPDARDSTPIANSAKRDENKAHAVHCTAEASNVRSPYVQTPPKGAN